MTSLMIPNPNLVNAYLENPKNNTKTFLPHLPKDKVVGLVTIRPKNKPSYFKKEFIPLLQTALLSGAEAIPRLLSNQKNYSNTETVIDIENSSEIIFNTRLMVF
jgi:hypothetical protein